MSGVAHDPELVADFLTESGELLEQLDGDLVRLERTPEDPELLNQVFRALHTIKGSASFLALTNLVAIGHAAESALNAARGRLLRVDREVMDLLLAAVDTIKRQMADMRAQRPLTEPDGALVARLTALGEERGGGRGAAAPAAAVAQGPEAGSHALALPASKMDLVEFFVADLEQTLDAAGARLAELADDGARAGAAAGLAELGESLLRSAAFFELGAMARLAGGIRGAAERLAEAPMPGLDGVRGAMGEALELLRAQGRGVQAGRVVDVPVEGVVGVLERAARGEAPEPADGARGARAEGPAHEAEGAGGAPAPSAADAGSTGGAEAGGRGTGEGTIRVEVRRLETLLNLVGELVLQKNRVAALGRRALSNGWGTQEFRELVAQSAGGLDRVTSDIQAAVMKTRMQPLDKIFSKYPRLIRDLARKLNKQIRLEIAGGDTEVDKSVIEELSDPLVHLLRNSADHGIETPEARRAAGKSAEGVIRLSASHEGSHVQLLVADDGRGLSRERIARRAVDRGLFTEEQVAAMSDPDVHRIIFAAGFSTAEAVSDVSGRGVGMDVVRTNIERLKGTIDLRTREGAGTTVVIRIPLTVAIMSAMMVAVGDEVYAVPLGNILEIVRPTAEELSTIQTSPVMRLRDSVLPLLHAGQVLDGGEEGRAPAPFAVVLAMSEKRLGLLVHRLIGQQEIVIKPLDGIIEEKGPVSGATVRDDGGVSLIVDVAGLFQLAEARRGR